MAVKAAPAERAPDGDDLQATWSRVLMTPVLVMREILAATAALVVGISTVQLANGFVGTLVSVRVSSDNFPSALVGPILAAYFGGYSLGAMIVGNVIQRIGHIRAFAALAGLVAASIVLQPVLVSAPFGSLPARSRASAAPDCSSRPRAG